MKDLGFRTIAAAGGVALAVAIGVILASLLDTPHPETIPWTGKPSVPTYGLQGKAQSWIGVKHKIGGRDRDGIDCSGLALELLEPLGAKLPRRAEDMRKMGRRVGLVEIRPGDLVFFSTKRADGLRGHVGVALDRNRFVHATASKGVKIDSLSSPWWGPRFMEARRVLE